MGNISRCLRGDRVELAICTIPVKDVPYGAVADNYYPGYFTGAQVLVSPAHVN